MDVLKYADINPDDAKHMAQRLHRKKDDLNFVRKVFTIDKVEAVDEERSIVARVSTNDRDRDGEVVEPKGIDLSNYSKNPCLLWAHRYDMPAIGKALWSKTDDKGLICKFQFAPTQFADEIYQLYKGGYQRAFSIGFIPMDFDSVEKVHRKVSLLEVSAVPVPANQDALVLEAYTKGIIKSDQLMQDLNVVMTPVLEKDTTVCEKDTDAESVAPEPEVKVSDASPTTTDWTGPVIFSTDKWSMAEAEAWVEEQKKDAVIPETKTEDAPAPDLAGEIASLRADVAAILAMIQAAKETAPAPGPVPVATTTPLPVLTPDEIDFEGEPDIVIEPSVLAKSAEELIDEFILSGTYKKDIAEAVTVALAKLGGKVI
jgi:HK97 family phage prohead protease